MHGAGHFWNIKVEAEKYDVTADDKISPEQSHYAVTVNRPGDSRFFAWKDSHTWEEKSMSCLYCGDAQGGVLHEVTSLADPVIQGTYDDYIVSGLFDSDYKYDMFRSQCL